MIARYQSPVHAETVAGAPGGLGLPALMNIYLGGSLSVRVYILYSERAPLGLAGRCRAAQPAVRLAAQPARGAIMYSRTHQIDDSILN